MLNILFVLIIAVELSLGTEYVVTDTLLPIPVISLSAYYDNDDSVYLIGGIHEGEVDGVFTNSILKYSISTQEISLVGNLSFAIANGGIGYENKNPESFYHFGGYNSGGCSPIISKHRIDSPAGESIGILSSPRYSFATVSDGIGKVYIIGGNTCRTPSITNEIILYDIYTNTAKVVDYLPPGIYLSKGTGVWVDDSVYLFGGYNPWTGEYEKIILKYYPSTGFQEIKASVLPNGLYAHKAVSVDTSTVYIVGGHGNQLLKYNTKSDTIESMDVIGLPASLEDTAAVFISKNNRIYLFGGNINGNIPIQSKISYIQL